MHQHDKDADLSVDLAPQLSGDSRRATPRFHFGALPERSKSLKYLNLIIAALGALLFVAPFAFGYSGNAAALWTSLILGALIAIFGYLKSYRWAAAMGVIAFVAPFLLGFSWVTAALWSCLILGFAVASLAGYQAFMYEGGESGNRQHGHT